MTISPRRVARMVGLTAVLSVALALPPVMASADAGPAFLRTLGGPNHAQIYPSGFAFAPDGTVVVADTGNDQVEKFSLTGTSYTQVWRVGNTGAGINQFNDPRDIGIDHLGNIYVADSRNSRIVKLDPNGNWITSWTGPVGNTVSFELGLSVHQTAAGEFLYVADTAHNKIRVFDLNGNLLKTFVSNGVCTFSEVRDVDADSAGNLYIANYTGNNILKLDPNGNCILKWGSNGTGDAQFKTPYGVEIAIDPVLGAEEVYIADANNNKIKEYTTGGTFLFAMGGTGSAPGQFTEIRRVAVDPNGDVWGADVWGWRLERFHRTASGYTYAQTVGTPLPPDTDTQVFHDPHGVAFVNPNLIGVMDTVHHRIVEFDPTTGHLVRTCGQRGSMVGQYNWPRGIAYDAVNDEFWVANTKQYNIHIVKPDCTPITKWGSNGAGLDQFNWPYSIAIRSSDRTAWIADTQNNRVLSYDVATRTTIAAFGTKGAGTGFFNMPSGIGIDPANGHILVADAGNNRVVELSDTNGSSITWVRTYTGFNDPQGVAADANGTIFVADTGNNRVVALSPTGAVLSTFTGPSGLSRPENIAVDPANQIFVVDSGNDRIQMFAPYTPQPPDTTIPVATMTSPSSGQVFPIGPVTFSGTATDNVGVTGASVAIKNITTNLWWHSDGTWGNYQLQTATLGTPGATSTTWSFGWTPPSTGSYSVLIQVQDAAGNLNSPKITHPFTVSNGAPDTTLPTVVISVPTPSEVFPNAPITFSGTAADNVGVQFVRVAIKNRTTNLWWHSDGTWGAYQLQVTTLGSPNATSTTWSFMWTPPAGAGIYSLLAESQDAAGNKALPKPTNQFSVTA